MATRTVAPPKITRAVRRLNRDWRILCCSPRRSPPYRIRPDGTRNRRLSSALDVRAIARPIRPDPVRRGPPERAAQEPPVAGPTPHRAGDLPRGGAPLEPRLADLGLRAREVPAVQDQAVWDAQSPAIQRAGRTSVCGSHTA